MRERGSENLKKLNKKIVFSISIVLFLLSICLILVPAPVVSAQLPTVLYDGSDPSWWSSGGTLSGTLGVSISSSTSIVEGSCSASLQVNLTSGSYGEIEIGHNYNASPQNWSMYTYLSFYFYGLNSSNVIAVGLQAPNQNNLIDYVFIDNFLGWQQINFPIQANTSSVPGVYPETIVIGTPNLSDITEVGWFFFDEPYVYYIDNVTLAPAPTVSISPTSDTLDVGQSQLFTATPSGGTGTYTSYQWYVGGAAQSGQTASTFSFTPGSSGSYSITATVTDSLGATSAQSDAAAVTVDSAPSISVQPSSATIDYGQTATLSSTVTGGTGSFIWQYYDGSGAIGSPGTGTSASYATSAADTGIYVVFTDTGTGSATPAATATSSSVAVTVNSALVAPTVTPTPGTVDQGQTSALTSTAVSSGSGGYVYQWMEKAPGGSYVTGGTNSASFSFVTSGSTATGVWNFELQVTDSTGAVVTSSAATVTVNASPTVSIAPVGPLTLTAGQVQAFTATPSGGSGTINYQWYLDGSAVGSNSASYSYTAAAGSHTVTCKVTDSASTPVTSPASNVVSITVSPAPTPPPATPTPTAAPTPTPTATPSPTPIPVTTASTTTTVTDNTAKVDQTATTGVSVTVSGSSLSNGEQLNVTSVNYGSTTPSGTSTLSCGAFYDVKVTSSAEQPWAQAST